MFRPRHRVHARAFWSVRTVPGSCAPASCSGHAAPAKASSDSSITERRRREVPGMIAFFSLRLARILIRFPSLSSAGYESITITRFAARSFHLRTGLRPAGADAQGAGLGHASRRGRPDTNRGQPVLVRPMVDLTLQLLSRPRHHVVLAQPARGGASHSASGFRWHTGEGEAHNPGQAAAAIRNLRSMIAPVLRSGVLPRLTEYAIFNRHCLGPSTECERRVTFSRFRVQGDFGEVCP